MIFYDKKSDQLYEMYSDSWDGSFHLHTLESQYNDYSRAVLIKNMIFVGYLL